MKLNELIDRTIREYLNENEITNNIWYHGSDYKFTSFNSYKSSGPSALGFFVTDDINLAEMFGENIYTVKLYIKKPYPITMDKWDSIRSKHAKDTNYFINMRNNLIENGYDGVFIKSRSWTSTSGVTFKDGNIVIVFDSKNIKIDNQ